VSLKGEIFPGTPREAYVQTEWAKGWTYSAIGFQEAARHLTEHRQDFGASIDQVGLVIFFLQRHRMELAMKEVLIAHGQMPHGHSLAELWKRCKKTIGPVSSAWQELDTRGSALVALIHEHDPDSTRYRYATDLGGRNHARPAFIDLAALEKRVTDFVWLLQGYLHIVGEEQEAAEHL
jgi:HEPN domain-containing protein